MASKQVHYNIDKIDKLDVTSIKTIFLGYSYQKKGYKCYDPKTKKAVRVGFAVEGDKKIRVCHKTGSKLN